MRKRTTVLMVVFLSTFCFGAPLLACSYQGQACGNGFCSCTWNPVNLNYDCACSDPNNDGD